ncbi:MAG: glycosyltransferase family 2 protein [Acidobacteriota bacterium]|jgi:glycosyltransferase involved in cell wall biosynthesis|nr:glycosyltransferase family 2 protein [Acidobacteriota bacterium]
MKQLSLVVCVYNEESNIRPLGAEIARALEGCDYEAIFVDDGSTDRTREEVLALGDERVTLLELKKNYGQSAALQAGIDFAGGAHIVLLDGDLQNDPADIPMMLKVAVEGDWDMVAGVRAHRKDGAFLRKIPSKIANYIIRKSTGTKMRDLGCTLKVFTREAAKSITIYGELHRFIPLLLALEGNVRIAQVDVNHRARTSGKSKYTIGRATKVLSDLMLMIFFKKYLQRPMHLFGGLGIATLGLGALINAYMLALKLMGRDIWGKPLLMLGVMLVLGGIQFVTIGIVAELQMRTYFEAQDKKTYAIRRIVNTRELR